MHLSMELPGSRARGRATATAQPTPGSGAYLNDKSPGNNEVDDVAKVVLPRRLPDVLPSHDPRVEDDEECHPPFEPLAGH